VNSSTANLFAKYAAPRSDTVCQMWRTTLWIWGLDWLTATYMVGRGWMSHCRTTSMCSNFPKTIISTCLTELSKESVFVVCSPRVMFSFMLQCKCPLSSMAARHILEISAGHSCHS
jgi:hypothetical protein